MRVVLLVGTAALLLLTPACNSNESVGAFANSSGQLAEVLPRVAELPYRACVDQALMRQWNSESGDLPNRSAAAQSCTLQALERDRLAKLYGVLTLYLETLGKLAAGKTQPSEQSVKSAVASAAGLSGGDGPTQSAVSGLAEALSALYLHARTAHKLKLAISAADPHLQALCGSFRDQIAPGIRRGFDVEEQQLQILYSDNQSKGALRLLLLRQFDSDSGRISEARRLLDSFAAVLDKVAVAHGRLFAHREHLNSREALSELLTASDAVAQSLKAISK